MTELEFAKPMALLAAAIGKPISEATLRAWFLVLGHLTPEQLQNGIVRTLRTHEFSGLPAIGLVLRNSGAVETELAVSDRAAVAWSCIRAAMSRHGAYATVSFDDPIVTATIRGLGGWVNLCATESGDRFDVWLRKDFERLYGALCQIGVEASATEPLAGLIDIANVATGHDQRAPVETVATGLPCHRSNLVRGHLSEVAEPPQPEVRRLAQTLAGEPLRLDRPVRRSDEPEPVDANQQRKDPQDEIRRSRERFGDRATGGGHATKS